MEELKKSLIDDYSNWVKTALDGVTDYVGIEAICVENFKLKLEKLCQLCGNTILPPTSSSSPISQTKE